MIRAEICGSLRRRAETIGDLDVLFSAEDPAPVLKDFVGLPQVAKVLAHGTTKASVLLPGFKSDQYVQCDLRGVEDRQFPFALHYFTGSKAHNIAIRRRALARGLSLNEYALTGNGSEVACRTEADLFEALGLAEIPAEFARTRGRSKPPRREPFPTWSRSRTSREPFIAIPIGATVRRRSSRWPTGPDRPDLRTWASPIIPARSAWPAD